MQLLHGYGMLKTKHVGYVGWFLWLLPLIARDDCPLMFVLRPFCYGLRSVWGACKLQPRASSALCIEMGEFADKPSSFPHVSKRMAVQRGFCLECFGMISWRVVFGPLK
ncbi:hypothetical protein YC2023_038216 [Brassica napus]